MKRVSSALLGGVGRASGSPSKSRLDQSLVLASASHSAERMSYATERVNLAAFEALRRLRALRPWVEAVARSSRRPLAPAEVLCVREHLALEYGLEKTPAGFLPIGVWDGKSPISGSGWPPHLQGSKLRNLAASFDQIVALPADPKLSQSETKAYLRQLMRATLSLKRGAVPPQPPPGGGAPPQRTERDADEPLRTYFCKKGRRGEPPISIAHVEGTHVLLGQGANGGHQDSSVFPTCWDWLTSKPGEAADADSRKAHDWGKATAHDVDDASRELTAPTNHIKEWLYDGEDLNFWAVLRENRDAEVAGFLSTMVNLGVGLVVSVGHCRASTHVNMCTLRKPASPYLDVRNNPWIRAKGSEAYRQGSPRDFFNFFGAPDADDGIEWRAVGGGGNVKTATLMGFQIVSRRVRQVESKSSGKVVSLYELHIEWRDVPPAFTAFGAACLGCCPRERQYRLQVLHVDAPDMAPVALSARQIAMVTDTLVQLPDPHGQESVQSPGVFIHCAGGIGRTGNVALALTEILSINVESPWAPEEKLDWLRSHRQGSVQTPEQWMDGVVLTCGLLADVLLEVWSPRCAIPPRPPTRPLPLRVPFARAPFPRSPPERPAPARPVRGCFCLSLEAQWPGSGLSDLAWGLPSGDARSCTAGRRSGTPPQASSG